MRSLTIYLAAATIAVWCGCNQSAGPQLAPVTGSVQLRGQPVVGARVIFNPAAGRPAQATTDDQGRFRLSTLKPGDGAVVGKHRVVVVTGGAQDMPAAGATSPRASAGTGNVPAQYGNADTSGLEFVVTPGKNDFAVELK